VPPSSHGCWTATTDQGSQCRGAGAHPVGDKPLERTIRLMRTKAGPAPVPGHDLKEILSGGYHALIEIVAATHSQPRCMGARSGCLAAFCRHRICAQ
jgi:hypothetical protein